MTDNMDGAVSVSPPGPSSDGPVAVEPSTEGDSTVMETSATISNARIIETLLHGNVLDRPLLFDGEDPWFVRFDRDPGSTLVCALLVDGVPDPHLADLSERARLSDPLQPRFRLTLLVLSFDGNDPPKAGTHDLGVHQVLDSITRRSNAPPILELSFMSLPGEVVLELLVDDIDRVDDLELRESANQRFWIDEEQGEPRFIQLSNRSVDGIGIETYLLRYEAGQDQFRQTGSVACVETLTTFFSALDRDLRSGYEPFMVRSGCGLPATPAGFRHLFGLGDDFPPPGDRATGLAFPQVYRNPFSPYKGQEARLTIPVRIIAASGASTLAEVSLVMSGDPFSKPLYWFEPVD